MIRPLELTAPSVDFVGVIDPERLTFQNSVSDA
jgi:hypothetical protein